MRGPSGAIARPTPCTPRNWRLLEDLADLLAIAQNVADRAVVAGFRLRDRLPVRYGEDVLLLDDRSAPPGELVDAIQLHVPGPRPNPIPDLVGVAGGASHSAVKIP